MRSTRHLVRCIGIVTFALAGTSCCELNPFGPECGEDYQPTEARLNVAPIAQQTQVWCWAASAEMIFKYYQMPNLNPYGDYQCGIVGSYFYVVGGPLHPCVSNCYLCQTGANGLTEIQRLINDYGNVAQSVGAGSRDLSSRLQFSALSLGQLAKELDEGRPVLAGISPQGISLPNISQHAVVIVGYDATGAVPIVYVNDPYPYLAVFQQDPYTMHGGALIAPGRYAIAYQSLVSQLRWGNTLFAIR